jgi:RNA polymerase sigma-70 factor (ECF subfamily)
VSQVQVQQALAEAHRREWAFVLAATVRVAGNLDVAEECVQDAFVSALQAWTRRGIPSKPGAWLTTAARRRALDVLRRDRTLHRKLPLLIEAGPGPQTGVQAGGEEVDVIPDDRLRLVFTCCHPALAREAQVALTLRLVCGLTTAEIAHAFLVSETTMAARITRAKKKIMLARIPYRVPPAHELPDRLDAVLTVVHLLFTSGHTAPSGEELVRADLVERALDLARMLHALMPDDREVRGLLALLLLLDARRATRTAPDGRLLLLEEQDRSSWDRRAIAEGSELVVGALRRGRAGRFTLQAAIAAVHAEAPDYAATDWREVLGLYDALLEVWPSPVVALNRAVAVAMVKGPAAGLAALEEIAGDSRLAGYPYLPAARADLLRRLGRAAEAARAYRAAISLATNTAERNYLAQRLTEVGGPGGLKSEAPATAPGRQAKPSGSPPVDGGA